MADVYCIVERTIKLKDQTPKVYLSQPLAYNNALAHAMRVDVRNDDGTAADLTGVGVTASFLKSNNETVEPINGTTDGSIAQVLLPASCYVTTGRFKFTMNLTSNGTTRTVLWVEGFVERNTSSTIIDPGTPVGNIEQAIGSANAAASAATTAATAANTAATNAANAAKYTAPTEASSTASKPYAVGDYFVYNGKLYITTSAIASGGTITPNTNCAEIPNGLSGEVGDLKSTSMLETESIPDTVQTIAFDSSGNVQSITHMQNNVTVRTDVFTFGSNTITEVRTLATGESLTIVTNTETLVTTVTYAEA